ncbi:unnamed protein product [Auanema sp. JU1783]|nr:unnamed protein product [Auanema sp. JU1783]
MDESSCGELCISCDLNTLIPLLYTIPTFILYFITIRLIYKNKEFHSLFYVHYVTIAVGNCLFWISQNILDRLLRLTIVCSFFLEHFGEPNHWFFVIKLIYLYCPLLIFLTSTLLILNRLTAICFPITLHNVWQNHQKKIVLFQFILPIVFGFHAIPWQISLEPVRWRTGLFVNYITTWPHLPLGIANSSVGAVCVFIMIISTSYTFYIISTTKIRSQNNKNIEFNLFLTALFLSSITIMFCAYQIIYFTTSQTRNRRAFYTVAKYRGPIVDVYSLLPAWVFALFQKRIRDNLFRRFHLMKPRSPVTTTPFNQNILISV